jgi:hypothetical protein
MSLADWTRRDGALWLTGDTDVSIRWTASIAGEPFESHVGDSSYDFRSLAEAVDWCEQVAFGRAILAGASPLPVDPADEDPTADQKFLAERGLSV